MANNKKKLPWHSPYREPRDPVGVNIFLTNGGFGDYICRLPAIKKCLEMYPHAFLHVVGSEGFNSIVRAALGEFPNINITTLDQLSDVQIKGRHSITFKHYWRTNLRTHLIDDGFYFIIDRLPEKSWRNYLQIAPIEHGFSLPEDYIVVTTGYTAEVRAPNAPDFNELVSYAKSLGIATVFLGSNSSKATTVDIKAEFSEEIDFSNGIDLRNQTSFLQAHSVIAGSMGIFGIDNGLIHLAGMTEVPIVVGYTSVEPEFRLPIRHNQLGWNCQTLVPKVGCRFCQSRMQFEFGHDFRTCYYGDAVCRTEVTAGGKLKKALDNILVSKL